MAGNLRNKRAQLVALLVSTVLGVLGVEWGLRWVYPYLPSISGLQQSDFRLERLVDFAEDPDLSLCHEVRTFLSHRSRWVAPGAASGVHFAELGAVDTSGDGQVQRYGSGESPQRLWIAGDSLAYGLGVSPEQTLGAHLSQSITVHTGGAVETRQLAVPGAGYCTALQRVAGALVENTPDTVLLVLSADDLEERLMLSVRGQLVAPPDLASGRLTRYLVQRSWFANLLWFRLTAWREASQDQKRFVGEETRDNFRSAMAELNRRVAGSGGKLLAEIVEPPGMPHCSGSLMQERCEWLKSDMETMDALLDEVGVPHTSIAGVWPKSLEYIVPREHSMASRGMLAMHPSAEGHRLLAEEVWPFLRSAM